jgi:6-phosphogluconolactonase
MAVLAGVVMGSMVAGAAARGADLLVYFGSRDPAPAGEPERGISIAHFDDQTGKLSEAKLDVTSAAPGYFVISADGKFLYAGNATSSFQGKEHMSSLSAFSIDQKTGHLTLINQVASGGENPANVHLDNTGKFLLVADYWGNHVENQGGELAVFAVKPDGSLGEQTAFVQHAGHGVELPRQNQAFVHSVIVDPTNRLAVACDLGLDRVYMYRFDEKTGKLMPNDPPFTETDPGSGPRHSAFHPNGQFLYVVSELANTVQGFRWDEKRGITGGMRPVSTLPEGWKGTNTAAEILVHPSGKFLYASNRGHDSVAEFVIDPDTSRLAFVQTVPTHDKTPRNMTFDPSGRWLLVSNQEGNSAVVFSINQENGLLKQVGEPVKVINPMCPRFLKLPQ